MAKDVLNNFQPIETADGEVTGRMLLDVENNSSHSPACSANLLYSTNKKPLVWPCAEPSKTAMKKGLRKFHDE